MILKSFMKKIKSSWGNIGAHTQTRGFILNFHLIRVTNLNTSYHSNQESGVNLIWFLNNLCTNKSLLELSYFLKSEADTNKIKEL